MINMLYRVTTGLLVCCYLIHVKAAETMERTECCIATLDRAKQNLTCSGGQVLSITNVTFYYEPRCFTHFDRHNCYTILHYCLPRFNQTLLSKIQQICNGTSSCIVTNLGSSESSAKVKYCSCTQITYKCIIIRSTLGKQTCSSAPPSTQINVGTSGVSPPNKPSSSVTITTSLSTQIQDSTSRPNNPMPNQISTHNQESPPDDKLTIIVGGVLGTALVISIVITILLLIHSKRLLKTLQSNHNEHQYNSSPSGERGGSVIEDYVNTPQQNDSVYEHNYDPPIGGGPVPVVVYDALYTREQSGYYNVDNINITGT